MADGGEVTEGLGADSKGWGGRGGRTLTDGMITVGGANGGVLDSISYSPDVISSESADIVITDDASVILDSSTPTFGETSGAGVVAVWFLSDFVYITMIQSGMLAGLPVAEIDVTRDWRASDGTGCAELVTVSVESDSSAS